VNVAGRGVGGDQSWGADAHTIYQINAASTTVNYNYSIIPVEDIGAFDLAAYSREIRNPVRNVKDLMPVALATGVAATDPAYAAADALAASASYVAAANAYKALIGAMGNIKPVINLAEAFNVAAAPGADNVTRIVAPAGSNLAAVSPRFETVGVGSNVVISPAGPRDFAAGPVTYTLTDGANTNEYTVYIGYADKMPSTITAFKFLGVDGLVVNGASGDTGAVIVDLIGKTPAGLSSATPDMVTINGEGIAPGMFAGQDFSKNATYTVTSIDGSQRVYDVVFITEKPAGVIIAAYNAAGLLVSVKEVSADAGSQSQINEAINDATAAGLTLKVFLWDENYVPLMPAVTAAK